MEENELIDGSIDAGLYWLERLTPAGVVRSHQEMAEAAGCTVNTIRNIEKSAIDKIKLAFERRGVHENFVGDNVNV